MVKPKLDNNHNLECVINILHLVSFVVREIIFYLISLNIMEFANLVKGIHWDFFEAFAVLFWSE